MKIGIRGFFATFLSFLVFTTFSNVEAGGLSTQLGEVVIENLQIGQTYNLRELANLQLIVTNTSDFPVDLSMDVLFPDSNKLKQQAAMIPDTSWVKLSQDMFTLAPNAKAFSDVIIEIPDDERYLGKKYQFTIWSHTVGSEGRAMFLAYGLKSRIIFTTDTVVANRDEIVTSSDASVKFTMTPGEIFLDNVELGKTFDLEKEAGHVLTVVNPSDQEQTFVLQSRTVGNSVTSLTDNYQDTPDASYLQFSESEFVLPAKGTKTINMYLNFPLNADYGGKQYMFIIHVSALNAKVTTGVYSRLYASVR